MVKRKEGEEYIEKHTKLMQLHVFIKIKLITLPSHKYSYTVINISANL